jgi:tRNA (cytidine/uridine-2'-O-)-methyltransferase
MNLNVVLYEPEIAQNTGSIIRICSCLNVKCHLIEPFGFLWEEKRLKRSMMDYINHVNLTKHPSWRSFLDFIKNLDNKTRLLLFDVRGEIPFHKFDYRSGDFLLFGKESTGVPNSIFQSCNKTLSIPIAEETRSLNLSLTVAMALSRALF